jgi:hypothetical protein
MRLSLSHTRRVPEHDGTPKKQGQTKSRLKRDPLISRFNSRLDGIRRGVNWIPTVFGGCAPIKESSSNETSPKLHLVSWFS